MAQVMEPKVTDTGFCYCGMPRRIGQFPLDWINPKDKTIQMVLSYLLSQNIKCIFATQPLRATPCAYLPAHRTEVQREKENVKNQPLGTLIHSC
jgi:hypothetical protein